MRELPIPVVLGGCASYHTGLHLMRTGAVGVLVGVAGATSDAGTVAVIAGSVFAYLVHDLRKDEVVR